MRVIETEVFTMNELPEEAKEQAYQKWLNNGGYDMEYSNQEAIDSIKGFANAFCIHIVGYSIGTEIHRSFVKWTHRHIHDDEVIQLSGHRAATYIWNNVREIWTRKYIWLKSTREAAEEKPQKHPMRKIMKISGGPNKGKYYYHYQSNIKIESGHCPFTGVCYDEDLLQPIHEFIQAPDGRTIEDLINEGFETLLNTLQSEYEHQNTREAFEDYAVGNGLEFEIDGTEI